MGQINSSQCSYHYLRTRHSEEGYCALCNERFSNLRGRDRSKDKFEEPCPCYNCTSKANQSEAKTTSPEVTQQPRLPLFEADQIYKCEQCPRFFYSMNQLVDHMATSQPGHIWNARFSKASDPGIDNIYKHRRIRQILDCLDASLLHIQRPEVSGKDLETERQHVCCVRCGIYFGTREQKRKHFRAVDDYIMRVEAGGNSLRVGTNRDDAQVKIEYPSAALFPPPPSTAISSLTHPSFDPRAHSNSDARATVPVAVSHGSPYIPELRSSICEMGRLPPLAARFGRTLFASASGTPSDSSVAKEIRIPDDFECPLCLDNETDVSSLPCGHIFCSDCISKTLDSDPRCPLCRRPAERSSLKRLRSA